MTALVCEGSVIVMHTYKISVTKEERERMLHVLNPGPLVVLSETNSDTHYFIIPADDTETLLTAASKVNSPLEKISISELKEKYSHDLYHIVSGDFKLVEILFQ